MRLLIIEDDAGVGERIRRGLAEEGHAVDLVTGGREGLFLATAEPYDVIVLDWMLPDIDGVSTLKAIRATGVDTPALILSARSNVSDKVEGLRSGADDYLTKPFSFEELLARLEVLRHRARLGAHQTETLCAGDLSLNLKTRVATRGGTRIELHPREFRLLEVLLEHRGRIVTRTMLLEKVWDYHFDPQTNVIDVHISRLRQKIDRDFDRKLIVTVRGAGYMIEGPD